MTTPRLSDLREPPIVGRQYLVPVISYVWHGKWDTWPVLGPLHNDVEHFNFSDLHYHIDARFLTAEQTRFAARRASASEKGLEHLAAAEACQRSPLSFTGYHLPKGLPRLSRRKCRAESTIYLFGNMKAVKALRTAYFDPAHPIRRDDGRLLCPHRKVDLSSFSPDANGLVTCPLHGLRVRCGSPE